MKAILLVITSLVLGISNYSPESTEITNQNCRAELKVEKNRSYKSADEGGASFVLFLENTSNSSATYTISTKNLESSCYDSSKSAGAHVSLPVTMQLLNKPNQSAGKVTLRSGEVLKFIVNVKVPDGTPLEKWSCIEVSALPANCPSSSINTILSVYVPNPSKG